jgi:hypothetical protein
LCAAYHVLGFDAAVGGDAVFRDLVLARIIEPTSKADPLRVLTEAGIETVDYRTVTRHLPLFAKHGVRPALSAACAAPPAERVFKTATRRGVRCFCDW